MTKWLVFAITTLILWGFWGVALKLASKKLDWRALYVFSNIAILVVILIFILTKSVSLPINRASLGLALAAGVCGTLGYITLILSMKAGGRASIVIPLTSLYPALTVILSKILLQESLNKYQVVGIILALVAIVLLSID